MVNSIKTLKRYSKATLNVFFDKKFFDDDKIFYLYDRFFVSNRNFTTEHVKIVKNSKFFPGFWPKLSNSRFFQVFWQPYRYMKVFIEKTNTTLLKNNYLTLNICPI